MMHSMWVFLKENVSRGSKLAYVVRRQENNIMSEEKFISDKENSEKIQENSIMFGKCISMKENSERKLIKENNIISEKHIFKSERKLIQKNNIIFGKYFSSFRKDNSQRKLIHGVNSPIHRRHDINKHYYELSAGEPSRNVIEMIFRGASTNHMKESRKIITVFKVKNSLDTLGRFEIYREMVKKKAYGQYNMHPIIVVNGNEQLRFFGTTMTCCQGEPSWVSEFCKEPSCGVCRMIQSIVSIEGTKKTAIQLSSSSEGFSDPSSWSSSSDEVLSDYDTWSANSKSKTVKRAAIVCRIIAGRVGNMVEAENEENYDSIQSERFNNNNNTDNLIVQNPSAVLPCFVVVFT